MSDISPKIHRLGLTLVRRNFKKGTRKYYDAVTRCHYVISRTGWVYRINKNGSRYQINQRFNLAKNRFGTAFSKATLRTIDQDASCQILIRGVRRWRRMS